MHQNATKARNVKVANRVVPAVQDAARLLVAGALQENCTVNGCGCSAFRKRKVRELSKKSRLAPA